MSAVDVLSLATLLVTGFVSCAEFGSYAFVHPVVRQLPATYHIRVEQGLLRTFGRIMPVGMTLCLVLAILHASIPGGPGRWDATTRRPTGSRLATAGRSFRGCGRGFC
jgi:hypothetical protein